MSRNDEFFIGYVDGAGPQTKSRLRRFVLLAFVALLVSALAFAGFQQASVNSSFDLSEQTVVKGWYIEDPYPILRTELGDGLFQDVVLLGFGKYGPEAYLKGAKDMLPDLVHKPLTVEGNLIYYNGRTFIQLTDANTVRVDPDGVLWHAPSTRSSAVPHTVSGEIVDPKCYFGVMKPGFGKIHRSCAALCIRGGIPPVLVVNTEKGEEYFLVTGPNGERIHEELIPYIGQPATLTGKSYSNGGWDYLMVDPATIELHSGASAIY
ncbi:hypothetical protein HZ996_05960 [Cryomorphaceae bacterium]|nr:hypothetical protein HZ996_05960 [Cryomorphaceae bacterium]